MITRREFFKRVLPDTGRVCRVAIMHDKSAPTKQHFYPVESLYDGWLDAEFDQLSGAGWETYFACCTFVENVTNRTAKQSLGYKCFRADIDCGFVKDYATQAKGLEALKQYLADSGLPMPMIVNSGRGWHVYWTLDEVIPYNKWKPVADALKQSMRELKFKTDPSVTADGARILRVPGTNNNKDPDDPKPVEVVHEAEDVPLKSITTALELYLADYARAEDLGIRSSVGSAAEDPLMRKMLASSEKSFSRILELSAQRVEVQESIENATTDKDGNTIIKQIKQKALRSAGCAQIDYIYKEQADPNMPYDLWRAGLSIAWNCSDRDTAIHDISRHYPEYDPAQTLRVSMDTDDKPQKCQQFQSLKPELCLNCIHKSKANPITTPITLGMTLIAATPEDNLQSEVWHEGLNETTDIEIPTSYPRNWFRPKAGGVAMRSMGDEDEDKIIYENDLWVQDRIDDPNHGAMLEIVRILPIDGLRVFTMPLSFVAKKEKMLETLAINHVAVSPVNYNKIQMFLTDWVRHLEQLGSFRVAREHFGWLDNDTKFLIGSREIQSDGSVLYSPPCSVTEEIASKYHAKGDINLWKQVINSYNAPGNEARAFAFFVGLGAPLYCFYRVSSMILHLTNSASGVGKSTALMAVNSIWGHPTDAMLNENDTTLSRQQRAGVLCNLPVTVDEITNLDGEEISNFVFHYSFNRGRNRMHSQSNAERKNSSTWNTPAVTSGNNSLYDSLRSFRSSTQGEMLRIMELHITRDTSKTKEEADQLFNHLLRDNYGLAGAEFMQYVLPNMEVVKTQALETQRRIDKLMGWTSSSEQRNYSALCGSAFTAAAIGKKLGLHDIDVDRVLQWAIRTLGASAEVVIESTNNNSPDVLGQFFNEHVRNVLTVNDYSEDAEFKLAVDVVPPNGELLIRYEPNTRRVYIARTKLQSWCAKQRIPFNPFVQEIQDNGTLIQQTRICLSRGTAIPGTAVWVVELDADKLNWLVDKTQGTA